MLYGVGVRLLLGLLLLTAASPVWAQPDFGAVLFRAAATIPGASAAVVTPDGVWLGGTGFADLAVGRPMTADTRMYLGSLSKPLTAATVLAMRDRGRLDVRARLTRYLPDWRCGGIRAVRIRDLLTHSAGIPREGGMEYWFTGVFPTTSELQRELVGGALEHVPGRVWSYSNAGYAALGPLVAARGGGSFPEVVRDVLLLPLGMTSSGARGPAPDVALAYTPENEETGRDGRAFAGLGDAVGQRRVRVYHDADAMAPAFGMYSTARDLARFVAMLLGVVEGSPMSEESRRQMLELQQPFPDDPQSGWTYGLRRTHDEHGVLHRHVGWFAAYRSHLVLRVDRGVGVVVLTNSDDGQPDVIAAALERAALR